MGGGYVAGRDQMKMTLHQDITIPCEIAQKLPSILLISENLFPSISARHVVVDGMGKTEFEEVVPPFSAITLKS
jgi:hypothetical protein